MSRLLVPSGTATVILSYASTDRVRLSLTVGPEATSAATVMMMVSGILTRSLADVVATAAECPPGASLVRHRGVTPCCHGLELGEPLAHGARDLIRSRDRDRHTARPGGVDRVGDARREARRSAFVPRGHEEQRRRLPSRRTRHGAPWSGTGVTGTSSARQSSSSWSSWGEGSTPSRSRST